jgi:hypothetical protein
MSVTRISVDSMRMRNGVNNPIRVEHQGKLAYADMVKTGPGYFVNAPAMRRPYGASVWFETEEPVILCVMPDDCTEFEGMGEVA